MTVWKLTQEQKEKYKNTYIGYIKDYADEFTYDFIKEVVIDFKTLKLMIDQHVSEFKKKRHTYEMNDLIEYVYDKLNRVTLITQQQSLNEVKNFGHWDIDFCTITGTIYIDIDNNKSLELSEFVNGYTKDFSDPFEDLHVDVLEEIKTEYEKNI